MPTAAQPADLGLRRSFLLRSITPQSAVLDLGCGAGEFSAALLQAGAHPIAVDVAHEALRRARERVPGLDARPWAKAEPLPLADAGVDFVWAGEVIEHVSDVAPWLSEVRRVLAPHGTLLLSTPHHGPGTLLRLALSRRAFAEHFEPRSDHVRFYSPATLRMLLEDFDFDVTELHLAGGRPGLRYTILARAVRR